jgi:exodeoxyribonuclease V gamma subunit
MRRLALGAFLAGGASGDQRVFASGGESYLAEELPAGSLDSAAGFVTLVRSLIEDARFCRRRKMPIARWVEYLQSLLGAYFTPKTEQDERDLFRCLNAVQSLEKLGLGEESVPYRIPFEFLENELSSLSSGRGQYLADGVVVSSFLPMRAIPFRVIFIAGLGEGKFPAPESRGALDLRQRRRYPGDVSARERDKSMFLETLLCARERAILSYVSRDALTGDEIPPSSVIRELRHLLETEYVGKDGFEKLVTKFPLRRYDEPSAMLEKLAPDARSERNARLLGESLRRVLLAAGLLPRCRRV